jgi:hypothetical protein
MDLLESEPLVLAVVPLHQIWLDDRPVAQPRKRTGLSCPLQRANEHESEFFLCERRPDSFSQATPIVS